VIKRLLILVAVLLILGLVGLTFAAGSLIRAGVEAGTAYCLDVPVKLAGASLNPLTGSVGLTGLEISNPPGYSSKPCFVLGSASVAAELTSLLSDPVVVRELDIEAATLSIEFGSGGTNLHALKERMDAKLGKAPAPKEGATGKKYLVKLMTIRGCKLEVTPPPGVTAPAVVTLPDLSIRDLGYQSGAAGATFAQLLAVVLEELAVAAGKSSVGFPAQIADTLSKEAASAAEQLRKSVESGDLEGVKKAVDDATKQLDDLLKKK
jgi:hypothetical protein